ncbi:MAG: DNA mismatch repair protein MutS [Polyangiaceae bacterium]|nr:DNA mismatch repair protein MutS [Polyangiaceae bacterium]
MPTPPNTQTPTNAAESPSVPFDTYAARLAELRSIAGGLNARSSRISGLRGITFLAALGIAIPVWLGALPGVLGWVAAAAGIAFLVLVFAHAILISRESAVLQRIGLVERAMDRLAGKPPPAGASIRPAPEGHPYAKDLDIFGKASLFELLDTTQTEPGESTLASWLASPSPPAAVAERQEAVREIAALHAFREDLAALGLRAETRGRAVDPLATWAEAPPVLEGPLGGGAGNETKGPQKKTLVYFAGGLVVLTAILFIAGQILGPERIGIAHRAWMITLLLQIGVLGLLRPSTEPLLATAASRQSPFGRYRSLFARIEGEQFKAPRIAALGSSIRGQSGSDASAAMKSLEAIIGYAEIRHNNIIHFIVNTALLWDVWCALALDRWRAREGRRVRSWFAALGEIEAIASLATYTFERPDHAFPELTEEAPRFEAEGLGHPLISKAKRVRNDVELKAVSESDGAPKGMALLITGSNMSGKSTLLRSMGVAAVMAQAGAPVCATRLRCSPLAVRTSMRIDDSLERGISHFYAELERLRAIVDTANTTEDVLFLLDEILHGTNSRERHIGAKAVVLHLIRRGAIGAVSSHDLALADLASESRGRIRNVHFEEIIREGRMAFDYKLKPGVVTTTNALRLMRLVGLDVAGIADETERAADARDRSPQAST